MGGRMQANAAIYNQQQHGQIPSQPQQQNLSIGGVVQMQ